ncbi:MAG: DUF4235 domain-containing protein [Solirubrobacterales bacterium]|nr:DUF4235 domain-containing protein [Solirubrobacterales bacterium]
MSLVFKPIGIITGLLAGIIGKKIFDLVWGLIDEEDAPEPQYREIGLVKLGLALVIQGAIFRAVRGLTEHGTRHAFARLTGEWPGEEKPEPKED